MSDAFVRRSAYVSPEAELLFLSARVNVTPAIDSRIRAEVQKDVNWINLVRLALRHGTVPLLYWNLQRICPGCLPKGIFAPLGLRFEAEARDSRRRAEELVRILGVLDENGICATPFKGPSLAQTLYGDLALRPFNDLDVVVREADVIRAQSLIRSLGYQYAAKTDEAKLDDYIRSNHELQFFRDDTRLDIHWRFTGRSAYVAGDPDRFLRQRKIVSLAGKQVRSLPLEANLLVLCLHAAKHRWRQLKLIADIAIILDHDLDWEHVLHEANSLGLKRVLAVSVFLAQDPIGATVPGALRRGLSMDSTTKLLVKRARQGFLEEPDENWAVEADYSFLSQVRERLRDRTKLYLNEILLPKFTPDERDRRFISVPAQLSAMYYVVRPVRMAWEKIAVRS